MMTTITEDRISDLPDEILHHILSSFEIKQVVHTSLLSRRWRYLWISVPNLKIDYDEWVGFRNKEIQKQKFENVADRVLFLRDDSDIHKFSYIGWHYNDLDRVDTWITSVIRRHVQEVHLACIGILKRTLVCLGGQVKTLELIAVRLPGGSLKNNDLHLSFSTVEVLVIEDCDYNDLKLLAIYAPCLKNLKRINAYVSSPEIKISAPSLVLFMSQGLIYEDYCLENFSSQVTAYVDTQTTDMYGNVNENKALGRCLSNLFRGLENVKSLTLSGFRHFQVFSEIPNIVCTSFHNLRYLKLTEWGDIRPIAILLESFPFIETLVLEKTRREWYFVTRGEDWGAQFSFKCMFHNLKTIEFQNVEGCGNDLKFLEVLLNNANVIENITITANTYCRSEEKTWRKWYFTTRGEDWGAPFSFKCMFHNLKTIEFQNVDGCGNDLKFLEVLLNNANVIENITITANKYCRSEKMLIEFCKKLRLLPRASSRVRILLILNLFGMEF